MHSYTVSGLMRVSCRTIVQANNEDEAKKLASERHNSDLSHQAMCDSSEEAWIIDELDGEVEIQDVEEGDEIESEEDESDEDNEDEEEQ